MGLGGRTPEVGRISVPRFCPSHRPHWSNSLAEVELRIRQMDSLDVQQRQFRLSLTSSHFSQHRPSRLCHPSREEKIAGEAPQSPKLLLLGIVAGISTQRRRFRGEGTAWTVQSPPGPCRSARRARQPETSRPISLEGAENGGTGPTPGAPTTPPRIVLPFILSPC
jgi:hypothetical protein